jgi:hypothetical protein
VLACEVQGIDPGFFTVEHFCTFDEECILSEDDPVELSKMYKFGHAIGRFGNR